MRSCCSNDEGSHRTRLKYEHGSGFLDDANSVIAVLDMATGFYGRIPDIQHKSASIFIKGTDSAFGLRLLRTVWNISEHAKRSTLFYWTIRSQ